jgi:hypothetical protein
MYTSSGGSFSHWYDNVYQPATERAGWTLKDTIANVYLQGSMWSSNLLKGAMSIQQPPDETITMYFSRFNSIISDVGKDKFDEKTWVLHWQLGLKKDIKTALYGKDYLTLGAICQAAKDVEELLVKDDTKTASSDQTVNAVKGERGACSKCWHESLIGKVLEMLQL